MGSTTTFAELIAAPSSEKIFLAECKVSELLGDWVQTGGFTNVYHQAYLSDTITLADGAAETIRKAVAGVREDGTIYTAKSSAAEVEATAATYYHAVITLGPTVWEAGVSWEAGVAWEIPTASEAGTLYIHTSTGAAPSTFTIMAEFWLYFATKGISLGGRYYEPLLAVNSIPRITQQAQAVRYGISVISSGGMNLVNTGGYFDQIAKKYYWNNGTMRLLLGGDALPYAEYASLFKGKIIDPVITSRDFSFSVKSISYDLLRALPVNYFSSATYPNLDPAAEGKPIPLYYGNYNKYHAPVVTCVNTAYGAGTRQVETATIVGTITSNIPGQLARVGVDSVLLTTSVLVYFEVALNDNASVVAGKARAALAATPTISGLFTITGADADIVLTAISAAENDATLNIMSDNWSATGLTTQLTSANTTAGVAPTVQFKICDTTHHPIKSITQVYIDNKAGAGLQPVVHGNEDLASATFTLSVSGTDYKLGTSDVKVAFVGYHSGGTEIEYGPEITEDLLTTWCGVAAADLDSASFTASMQISLFKLNVPIEERTTAMDVITRICQSDCTYFSETTTGTLRYKTWEAYEGATPAALTEADVQDVSFREDFASVYKEIRIGYAYRCSERAYNYASQTASSSLAKYQKREILAFDTYIRSQADASTHAFNLLVQSFNALLQVTFSMSAAKVNALIGDVFALTLARSPSATAGGQVNVVYEIIRKELSAYPLKVTFTGRQMMIADVLPD